MNRSRVAVSFIETSWHHRTITVLLVSMVHLSAACSSQGDDEDVAIRVGLLIPRSGQLASLGEWVENTNRMALDEVNDAGGVGFGTMAFVARDNETDPEVSKAVATDLIDNEGVSVLLGPQATNNTLPVATEVTIPRSVLLITGSSSGASLTDLADNDYVFRTVVSTAKQGTAMAQKIYADGKRNLATLTTQRTYTIDLTTAVEAEFVRLGGTVVHSVQYEDNPPVDYDFKPLLDAAYATTPDAIYLGGYTADVTAIFSTWDTVGYDAIQWYVSDALDIIAANLSPTVIEGVVGSTPGYPERVSYYMQKYDELYDGDPGIRGAENYDATIVLALAVAKAGVAETDAIRDALRDVANPPGTEILPGEYAKGLQLIEQGEDIDFKGVASSVDFDGNGDVSGLVDIWQIDAQGNKEVLSRVEL